MPFKLCAVGCGWIANAMHGPSFVKYKAEHPGFALAGCCDIDLAKAEAYRARFGFSRAYTDMDAMLAEQTPDAVVLMSPVELTAELAAGILEKSIPLLLEKPPGRTGAEVRRLMEIAERKGVPHRVALNRRYSPLVRTLKGRLDCPPESIQSVQYDMFRVNRRDDDFAATAVHAIDAARFIAGSDYGSIRFTYREYPELGQNVADIHMQCETQSGTAVTLNICPVAGINVERAAVNLPGRTFFLDYLGNALLPTGRLVEVREGEIVLDTEGSSGPDGAERFEREGFYWEDKTFFDDIIAGRIPSGTLMSSLQSVEVADCIRMRMSEYSA